MKRRDALKAVPLAIAGLTAAAHTHADESMPLGLRYTAKIRALLERIVNNQSAELMEASHRIADAVQRGNTCRFNWDIGHSNRYDLWPDRPGMVDFMTYGIPDTVKKGDVILCDSYDEKLERLHSEGAFLISGPRPWGGDCRLSELLTPEVQAMKIKPYADLWIENYSTAYGAIMDVPGEIAPTGPDSGVVGMTTFWMIVSDAARLLAGTGKTFNVQGDEPALAKNSPRVSTAVPLGEKYYESVIASQHALDLAFADIDRIADMVVHSVLTGGRIYIYSRYGDNLCVEGTVRRGGLGLTFGVSGPPEKLVLMDDPIQQGLADLSFKPTAKDIVIMGIGKPDDPDDLASFDIFRKAGMGVAVLGPATRNGVVPAGRSVTKEADVYIGAMTDTYGLFALPGITRKVSPTSGWVNNQAFWALCCQIAEKIVQRTGNAPGIYLSGALKGGMEKLNEVKRLYKQRGY